MIEEEIPFEVPKGWVIERLGNITTLIRGSSPRPISNFLTDSESGVNWIKIGDAKKYSKYISSTNEKITPRGAEKSRLVYKGDFLLSNSMSFGLPYILNIDGAIHDGWFAISNYQNFFSSDFLYYLLSSNFVFQQFIGRASGSAIKNISSDRTIRTILPIPPAKEQERIVKVVIQMFEEIELIEKNQTILRRLSTQLNKEILSLAICGKLVPQNPNDEIASILLERIRNKKEQLISEGKLKRNKNESTIIRRGNSYYEKIGGTLVNITEQIPFTIPKSWSWIRLGEIFDISSSKRVMKNEWTTSGIPFYRAREIVAFKNNRSLKDPIFISKDIYEKKVEISGKPSIGDILITGVGTLGITFLVSDKKEFYFKDGNVIWLKNMLNINPIFIQQLLDSPYLKKIINHSNSTTVGTLTIDKAKSLLIPFPPLNEQNRIVEKLKEALH